MAYSLVSVAEFIKQRRPHPSIARAVYQRAKENLGRDGRLLPTKLEYIFLEQKGLLAEFIQIVATPEHQRRVRHVQRLVRGMREVQLQSQHSAAQ